MYKLCKTEESAKRQRQLELALLDALHTQSFDEISVSDLCEQIHVPRKSFYRYFSGKEGALIALLDHTMIEFNQQESINERRSESNHGDLERFFCFWYEHRALLEALERNNLNGLLVERAILHAEEERMIPMHLRACSKSEQTIALNFLIAGLLSVVSQWHREEYKLEPNEMAQNMVRILSKAFLAN